MIKTMLLTRFNITKLYTLRNWVGDEYLVEILKRKYLYSGWSCVPPWSTPIATRRKHISYHTHSIVSQNTKYLSFESYVLIFLSQRVKMYTSFFDSEEKKIHHSMLTRNRTGTNLIIRYGSIGRKNCISLNMPIWKSTCTIEGGNESVCHDKK